MRLKPFFRDNQVARLIVQLAACFGRYQVRTGDQRDGKPRRLPVPIRYGDYRQTVAYLINKGSDNAMAYIPRFSLFLTALRRKAEWSQNPYHVERFRYVERARDPDGNLLINVPGRKMTIERFMPVPYDVNFDLTFWARRHWQGYQMIEQIATEYNPRLEIQLRNSPADWSYLTYLTFRGEVKMEKVVPSGTQIDPLYTFVFPMHVVLWMRLPAKVYQTKVIEKIFVPIEQLDESQIDFERFEQLAEVIIIPTEEQLERFEATG